MTVSGEKPLRSWPSCRGCGGCGGCRGCGGCGVWEWHLRPEPGLVTGAVRTDWPTSSSPAGTRKPHTGWSLAPRLLWHSCHWAGGGSLSPGSLSFPPDAVPEASGSRPAGALDTGTDGPVPTPGGWRRAGREGATGPGPGRVLRDARLLGPLLHPGWGERDLARWGGRLRSLCGLQKGREERRQAGLAALGHPGPDTQLWPAELWELRGRGSSGGSQEGKHHCAGARLGAGEGRQRMELCLKDGGGLHALRGWRRHRDQGAGCVGLQGLNDM